MLSLSVNEKAILDILQMDFPLVSRPFKLIGDSLGLDEMEVIETVLHLKECRIIRQIGAIYNTVKMGFKSTLVAASVEESELEQVAAYISSHPGVSHNYRRGDEYNLWFTMALPGDLELEEQLEKMRQLKGVKSLLPLPSLKVYKRRVIFRLSSGKRELSAKDGESGWDYSLIGHIMENEGLKQRLLYELQKDLFIETKPFEAISHKTGVSEEQLFCLLAYLKECGVMSRFAAIIRNQQIGFTNNAMVVWKVPEQKVDRFGEQACRYEEVSHCYLRESYPEWDYNLYTMIHGREKSSCDEIIDSLKEHFGADDYRVLYSTKEYKKQRVDYFSRDYYSFI